MTEPKPEYKVIYADGIGHGSNITAMTIKEHDEQAALFEWAKWQENNVPELALLYANVNGQYRPGQRPEAGMKSGVPDICLPVCRKGFAALYIELKVGKNKPSDNQLWWIGQLRLQGNMVAVCYGFDEAKRVIEEYLGL